VRRTRLGLVGLLLVMSFAAAGDGASQTPVALRFPVQVVLGENRANQPVPIVEMVLECCGVVLPGGAGDVIMHMY
jgi:hypothetical protein